MPQSDAVFWTIVVFVCALFVANVLGFFADVEPWLQGLRAEHLFGRAGAQVLLFLWALVRLALVCIVASAVLVCLGLAVAGRASGHPSRGK